MAATCKRNIFFQDNPPMPATPPQTGRRSIRLRDYDYAQAGAYFITICTQRRALWFQQAAIRTIAEQCWSAIPEHFPLVELDEWIVMPNHVHGIIVINDANEIQGTESSETDAPHRTGVQLNAPPAQIIAESTDLDASHRTGVQLNAPAPNRNALQCNNDINALQRRIPARNLNNRYSIISPYRNTLAVVVRTYKAAVTTRCRRAGYTHFEWQRNYHERIIREERDLNQIRQYIANNPSK
jgi:putative transposase